MRLLVDLAVPARVGVGREVGEERRVAADLEALREAEIAADAAVFSLSAAARLPVMLPPHGTAQLGPIEFRPRATQPVRYYYEKMRDALNATGRPIHFNICSWGAGDPHLWGRHVGNSWRTGPECLLEFESFPFPWPWPP